MRSRRWAMRCAPRTRRLGWRSSRGWAASSVFAISVSPTASSASPRPRSLGGQVHVRTRGRQAPSRSRRFSARSGDGVDETRSRTDDVDVFVEYAGILAAVSLMAITLTGAYGKNVEAVFNSSSVGVAAVGKAAKAQKVSQEGAKTAYRKAPYAKPALKYLYALGWIGGTRNP